MTHHSSRIKAAPAGSSTTTLKVKKIGNSVGLILPKDLLARLDLKEGDTLHITEAPERELRLTPFDDKHAKAMTIAREMFRDYADTFKALAK
jgi:putative addiction module antidote